MKDHTKPSMKEKPGHTIFHVGTNNLNSNRPPNLTTKFFFNLDISLKNNLQNVSVSNIIMRNDNFNDKAMEVNGCFKQFCIDSQVVLY